MSKTTSARIEIHGFATYPQLVLGIQFSGDFCPAYTFKPGREFVIISHQCAGHACLHKNILGTVLTVKDVATMIQLQKLCNKWEGSCCGQFYTSLDDLINYREDLRSLLNCDCNRSYQSFVEGWYPVDLTDQSLAALASDILPSDHDDLIEWEYESQQFCGIVGRWSLVILGQNCD